MWLLAGVATWALAPSPSLAAARCHADELEWGGFRSDLPPSKGAPDEMVNSWSKPLRVVLIHGDGPPTESEGEPRSVWVNVEGRRTLCFRKLLSPRRADDPKRNLMSITQPIFSPDGRYLYVRADAWTTSPATHQINLGTGAERFVVDGAVQSVIRTGPYGGMLLVSRHKYHPAPQLGSYDPVDVVRPDGKVMLTVPGSEADEGEPSVAKWLKANGWRAH